MRALLAGVLALGLAGPVAAQDQTLADIRVQLGDLYLEVQRLRTELVASGATGGQVTGATPLERLDQIESELQRLTSLSEELEFRINRVVTDGTNRIGDLEFQLCELTTDCDIGALGEPAPIGGVDVAATVPTPLPPPATDGPALAVSEQADFDRAEAALNAGNPAEAAQLFATFAETYPGGPLSARAQYLRGQALEELGDMTTAARAYLQAFSGDTDGSVAPDALFKLGSSLASLGQVQDACITLTEVGVRYPGTGQAQDAQAMRASMGCP